LAPAHGFFNSEKTKPDLHLIKQVEQVTGLRLEAPPAVLPGFGAGKSGEDDDPHICNLAIIGSADISLQKTTRTARSG
jgi:hypothetical protein